MEGSRREAGKRENNKARGGRWEGEREEGSFPPFLSSLRPPRAYYFFNYYWNIQRDPCRGEREGRKHN